MIMKKAFKIGLRLIVSAVIISASTTACGKQNKQQADTQETMEVAKADGQPFKGLWYADDAELEIDFYGNSIAIDGPDEEYGPGNIKYGDGHGYGIDISSAKITGNKATATLESGITVTLEATDDGNLVMRSSGITYTDANGSEKELPATITLKRKQ